MSHLRAHQHTTHPYKHVRLLRSALDTPTAELAPHTTPRTRDALSLALAILCFLVSELYMQSKAWTRCQVLSSQSPGR